MEVSKTWSQLKLLSKLWWPIFFALNEWGSILALEVEELGVKEEEEESKAGGELKKDKDDNVKGEENEDDKLNEEVTLDFNKNEFKG